MLIVHSARNISYLQSSSAWLIPTYPSDLSSKVTTSEKPAQHPFWVRCLLYTQVEPPALLLSRTLFASVCKHKYMILNL